MITPSQPPSLAALIQRRERAVKAGAKALIADMEPKPCTHPPARLYTWFARDDSAPQGRVLCIACCDCGAVIKGGC